MKTNVAVLSLLLHLPAAVTLCCADENPIANTPLYLGSSSLKHPGYVKALAFSPDGKILAVGGWQNFGAGPDDPDLVGTVKLWNSATRGEIRTLKHGGREVNCLAFAPDGTTLVSGSQGSLRDKTGTVKLWNSATGEEVAILDSGAFSVLAVVFSPNGKIVAAADSEGIVTLWDVNTHKRIARFQGNESIVGDLAFAPDGKTLAAAGGKRGKASVVKLWDVSTAKEIRSLAGSFEEQVTAVAYAADGSLFASTRGKLAMDVLVWNTTTWKSRAADGGTLCTTSLVFSPDGSLLAVGDNGGFVALVDVASGKRRVLLASGLSDVRSVAFSPDGKSVAAAGMVFVMLWDVEKSLNMKKGPETSDDRDIATARTAPGAHTDQVTSPDSPANGLGNGPPV